MVGAFNKNNILSPLFRNEHFASRPLANTLAINNCLFTFNHHVSLFLKAKLDEKRKLFYCIEVESKQIIQRQIKKVFRRMSFFM